MAARGRGCDTMTEHSTNVHSSNGMAAVASDDLARSLSAEADYVPHKFVQVSCPHLTRTERTHAQHTVFFWFCCGRVPCGFE